ncbi:MAG: hypothetical protein LBN06_10620, partial [Prevotellaceae bacterium]|nr:hypothetical protein [Prevotellaceae bacterium]
PVTGCYGQLHFTELKKKSVQRELLREYFLCVSITEGFKEKHIEDMDISQSVYFDIGSYAPEAYQEVKAYAKEFVASIEPSLIDDLDHKKAIIMDCIEKYNSKELKKFIKSMDKYLLMPPRWGY